MVNLIYGKTGTEVTSLDLFQKAPWPSFGTNFVKGDAFKMPFADKSHDLVINNWMLAYFMHKPRRDQLKNLLEEHIRVTRDGGEIKIGFGMIGRSPEEFQHLAELLHANPRVESFQFVSHFPVGRSVSIKIRETEETRNRSGNAPEVKWTRRGMALLPLAWGASIAGMTGYYYFPTSDTIDNMEKETFELESLILKNTGFFTQVKFTANSFTSSDIKKIRKALALLKEFYTTTDPKEISPTSSIFLDDKNPTAKRIGTQVRLPINSPESGFSLLRH
jgi:SAM-dependent methyltransferase